MGYKVKEHPDHFEVDDGDGPFKIAKSAIPEHLHDKVRKMAKGGKAKVEDLPDTSSISPDAIISVAPADRIAQPEDLPGTLPSTGDISLVQTAGTVPQGLAGQVIQPLAPAGADWTGSAGHAPPPAPPAAPKPKPRGESDVQQYEKAEKGQEAAAKAQADVVQQQAAIEAMRRQEALERQAAYNQHEDPKEAAHQQELQAAITDLKAGKINPNQYWEQAGFGGKAAAVIALALGTIGSSLVHGPNVAAQIIQSQISQNIEAQVKNQEAKSNLVNTLSRQGYDMRQARQMAEARMKDRLAMQLEANASDFLGDKAQAGAATTVANLRADSMKIKSGLRAEGLDAALKGIQIQSAELTLEQQQMDKVAMAQMILHGSIDPQVLSRVSPGMAAQFQQRLGPNPEEQTLGSTLEASKQADISPLLAKIPFTASKAEREAHAADVTQALLQMEGLQPSKRMALYEDYHNVALDLTSPDSEKRDNALAFFMHKMRQHQAKRATGFVTPRVAPAPAE